MRSRNATEGPTLSIIEVLVLAHLSTTAVLLVVLCAVIGAQGLGRATTGVLRRAGVADERTPTAAARRTGADVRRPVPSST
jgi:hypothetical protein